MNKRSNWTSIGVAMLASCVLQSPQSEGREPKGSGPAKSDVNMTDAEDDPVDTLLINAVSWLSAARGNAAKVEAAIERYLKEGDALDLSPYELRDYFDISSPTLPEQAQYSQEEQEAASAIFTRVSRRRYGSEQ
jgi:hypothetical protein